MKKAIITLGLLMLLTFTVVSQSLPEPTGPYTVGTTTFMLEDKSRQESFTPEKGDFRKLVVQAWYPAMVGSEKRAPYLNRHIRSYLQEGLLIPAYELDRLQLSNSYIDAALLKAEEKYPVVIYAHGLTTYEGDNFHLMEDIASHGYIVYSINYSHIANISLFREEVIATFFLNPFDPQKIHDMSGQLSRTMLDDTLFFIDSLDEETENCELFNNLRSNSDEDNIGMLGYSFGGSTVTVLSLLKDSPLKAGINMDGDIILPNTAENEKILSNNLKRPFLFLQSEATDIAAPFFYSAEEAVYNIILKETTHTNFTILTYFPSLRNKSIGNMDSSIYTEIISETIIPFFDTYLKGNEEALKDSPVKTRANVTYNSHNTEY